MKKLFFSVYMFLLVLGIQPANCQTVEGQWEGVLEVMGTKLPLIFKFVQEGDSWKGSMDSPSQGAKGIELSKVLIDENMVAFEIAAANIQYEGLLLGEMISGTFKQSGMSFPLDLSKMSDTENEDIPLNRPQTPKEPFPYFSEDVSFQNTKEGITLEGTLTIPDGEGPFPAVILVTGSGPQDRNSTIFDHEPFLVIADFLSRNGIIVLRYDERGVGESDGDFSTATSEDFKNDTQYGLQYLRELPQVQKDKVGMLGHSEGGMIAWMLAAENHKTAVDFIIALAGPVVEIPDLMAKQTEDISRSTGNTQEMVSRQVAINRKFYNLIKENASLSDIKSAIPDLVDEVITTYDLPDEVKLQQKEALLATLEVSLNPWLVYFIQYIPEEDIRKIEIPVFAAFGGKDLQVNAAQNGNKLIELFEGKEELLNLQVYEDLNHLFQKADTGAVAEYQEIEETFNQQVLDDILEFIRELKR
ncbi:alpha/beta hydrolase family protein [Mongoliibacter ruber]|uniref:Serine aminopeptidase S33 domain-containing protein n=1 Tax=Mongoliibacter ruber TaxID=1750599 RepID=A0A2T0WUS4_9BACT|nr:alpha/beta fold hydrolase [Mongoliibacter ruber]PRY90438.1 hypothetical protein CLW00_10197 [Mongoliibacter ruber]